eukprot:403362477
MPIQQDQNEAKLQPPKIIIEDNLISKTSDLPPIDGAIEAQKALDIQKIALQEKRDLQRKLALERKKVRDDKKAVNNIKKQNKMKTFLDDFYQAEDFFTDVVPEIESKESRISIISRTSWYVEGELLFSIELKDCKNTYIDGRTSFLNDQKVQECLDNIFNDEGAIKTENNLLETIYIKEETNNRLSLKSNFCLKIYTLTDLRLVISYDLAISHLNYNFLLQVYDDQYLAIICENFYYQVYYKDFLRFAGIYLMDYKEEKIVLKKHFSTTFLSKNFKSKHLLYQDDEKCLIMKLIGFNHFEEIEYITTSQKSLVDKYVNYNYLTNDTDNDTITTSQWDDVHMVFNYKDSENRFFYKYTNTAADRILFHSGNKLLCLYKSGNIFEILNETCQLSQASIDQNLFYFQLELKIIGIKLQASMIKKSRLKYKNINEPFSLETHSSLLFNEKILEKFKAFRFILSENNKFILAINNRLDGVIFDVQNQILIKHEDLKTILYSLTMTENQFVLIQLNEDQVVINKYQIQCETLIKSESYNLTQHFKQFDINNEILPRLISLDDQLIDAINDDQSINFFYLNENKNIVIFRLKIKEIGSQDYLMFQLDTFKFIGSFSVNKPLFQMNYFFYCADEKQVYRTNIINQLIEHFKKINPNKLHVKIDVVLNKYEFFDLENKLLYFTQYQFKSLFDLQMIQQNHIQQLSDIAIIKEIKKMSESEIFSYNTGIEKSFIYQCKDKKEVVLEEIYKRLLQINPQVCPQICSPHQKSPFHEKELMTNILEYSVGQHQYRKISIILEMIIKFNNNLLFNNCIDSYICYMLQKKINLKEYIESNLAFPKITSLNYPQYSKNSSVIYQSNIDATTFSYFSLWHDHKKYLGDYVQEGQEVNDEAQVQVEQFLINIPCTMKDKDFVRSLIESENLEYFETELIQTVLNFKWERYAEKFFINQFYLYIVFLLFYVTDLYFFTISGGEEEDQRSMIQQLVLKLTCVGYLVLQEYYEMVMMKRMGFINYIKDLWNIIDQVLALLYILIVIIDIQNIAYNAIVIMHGFMLIIVFIKFIEILRVFQGFSYQVSMLRAVFYDLRYFILLYGIVVIVYGLIFTLLKIKTSDENVEYEGINYLSYFIMAFRASTGDFQIDNFYQLEDTHIIFAWIVWISAVLFLNIILLNFIIAVISESYEKVMQKMVAESFRIKAQLIKEREYYLSEEDFQNPKYFPGYVIFRRPVVSQVDDNQEWQGFVKDIKKTIYKTHIKSFHTEEEILHNIKTVKSTVQDLQTIIKNQDQIIKNQENSIQNQEKTIQTLQVSMNKKFDEIKAQNEQIINYIEINKDKESKNDEQNTN